MSRRFVEWAMGPWSWTRSREISASCSLRSWNCCARPPMEPCAPRNRRSFGVGMPWTPPVCRLCSPVRPSTHARPSLLSRVRPPSSPGNSARESSLDLKDLPARCVHLAQTRDRRVRIFALPPDAPRHRGLTAARVAQAPAHPPKTFSAETFNAAPARARQGSALRETPVPPVRSATTLAQRSKKTTAQSARRRLLERNRPVIAVPARVVRPDRAGQTPAAPLEPSPHGTSPRAAEIARSSNGPQVRAGMLRSMTTIWGQ